MKKNLFLLLLAFTVALLPACKEPATTLSLAGNWQFAMDSTDVGIDEQWYNRSFTDEITLPGTLDEAGYGTPNPLLPSLEKPQVLHLTRKVRYVGPAWYLRSIDIPSHWEGKDIVLHLERTLWQTQVWVDGQAVGPAQESLTTPHRYDLTPYLTPGRHTLAIRVDNRKQYDISTGESNMAHAYTDHTQIIWNGLLGELSLKAYDQLEIADLQVYPNAELNKVCVKVQLNRPAATGQGTLHLTLREKESGKVAAEVETAIPQGAGSRPINVECPIDQPRLWDELHPHLYELSAQATIDGHEAKRQTSFGMRQISNKDARLQINGQPLFLRGTLECCIFPLTGRPPMQTDEWLQLFQTAREWGLNHLRFHSWCPPTAAFEAADQIGFYLQVELPVWSYTIGEDEAMTRFLRDEADRILKEYGNHPSFCFLSMGNELQSDFTCLEQLMQHVKQADPRHLYTTTSFTFERGHGDWPEALDDYFVTQWTRKGWVRGQGVFNAESPNFSKDYSASVEGMPVPVVTHEIGQYAVYPDLREIEKYTGVLDPLNLKGVRSDLQEKGLLHKANDYLTASGKLACLLYKEEIERALKTPGISGFQLLDLHDFPGQGTALVGLLNAFWESKGIIGADEFRQFCSPTVPLARFPQAVYRNSDRFEADIEIANYGNELPSTEVVWELADTAGNLLHSGTLGSHPIGRGVVRTGKVTCPLSAIDQATRLVFTVRLNATEFKNSWNLWVYPCDLRLPETDIVVTRRLEEALASLRAGKKVLFNPPYAQCNGLPGKFVPVFWSPVHFPTQAGTMGLLLAPEHPAFTHFPTDGHTDWQWWSLTTQSCPFITDSICHHLTPLVECVDNFANNRRLSPLFEAQCEKGSLVVCSMDLMDQQEKFPEKRQLLYSLLRYMQSDDFHPSQTLSATELQSLLKH